MEKLSQRICKSPKEYFLQYLKEYCSKIIEAEYSPNGQTICISYSYSDPTDQELCVNGIKVNEKIYIYIAERYEIDDILSKGCEENEWVSMGGEIQKPEKSWSEYIEDLQEIWRNDCRKYCKNYESCIYNLIGFNCIGLGGKYYDPSDTNVDYDWFDGKSDKPLK